MNQSEDDSGGTEAPLREDWMPNFMHVHASHSFFSRMTREVKNLAAAVVNETNRRRGPKRR